MIKPKLAVIFGVTGQDGSYLAEYLLRKNYTVLGVKRRSSTDTTVRLRDALQHRSARKGHRNRLYLLEGDVTDYASVSGVFSSAWDKYNAGPDEVYNLAAQSHVHSSFDQPLATWDINANGVLNILENIRRLPYRDSIRFYQASTSEMFGDNFEKKMFSNFPIDECKGGVSNEICIQRVQTEETRFNPRSPYAVAKVAAHQAVNLYRDAYGLYACCGILFNHESPRRGENFVTRKITKYVGELYRWCMQNNITPNDLISDKGEVYIPGRTSRDQGFQFPKLQLGNLDAKRDWGDARDYVRAMHMMLQQNTPDDYIVATGASHTVGEFCHAAFQCIDNTDYTKFVEVNPDFLRPSEVPHLQGISHKIRVELGWAPQITFEQMVGEMVSNDITLAKGVMK